MRRLVLLLILNSSFLTLSAQQWLWGKFGVGDALTEDVSTDNQGNCYMSGLFPNDTIHFGSYVLMNSTVTHPPQSSYWDPFLVKYNSKGGVVWARQWVRDTSKHTFTTTPVSVTANNRSVYLNANFTDSLKVGPYTLVNNGGSGCTCVARYDSNGNLKWVRIPTNSKGPDTLISTGENISSDKFGNLFLLGNGSYDTITFGAYHLYYNHCIYFNDFLVKYDSSGNVKWAKQAVPLNGNSSCVSNGLTTDLAGNVFTTGGFNDTVKYGAFVLGNNITNADFNLIKWDSAGNVLWVARSRAVNSNSIGGGQGVITDKHGNVYVCGDYTYDLIIGLDTLRGGHINNTNCFFVAKYSSSGTLIWVKQAKMLDNNQWFAWSISCDNNSNIYISGNGGYGTCKLAFGGDTLSTNDTSVYDASSYVFKLDSNGNAICGAIIPGGGYNTFSNSISSDTSGKHVYLGTTVAAPTVFGNDTVNPYSYTTNAIQGINFFPALARWQACDTNIFQAVPEAQKPLNGELVYPNPNNGNFTIALQNINGPAQVEIYNMLGEQVQSKKLNENSTQVEMSDQTSGVYFYRVVQENGSLIGSGKIVIEK